MYWEARMQAALGRVAFRLRPARARATALGAGPGDVVTKHPWATSLGSLLARAAALRVARAPVECRDGPQSHITRWYITDEVGLLTLVPPIALLTLSNRTLRK